MSETTRMHVPVQVDDPVNARILRVSEDRVEGFQRDPFGTIARRAELPVDLVLDRLRAMLEAGVIRRIRQTMLSTSLAPGALVAWEVPADRLHSAFDFMFQQDPFSGHVVIRTTDAAAQAGGQYRLWTTLKVPSGFDIARHCQWLMAQAGATRYRLMPAKKVFTLGVGHVRRRELEPGERTVEPGRVLDVEVAELDGLQWRVLMAMKRELDPEELRVDLWSLRAAEAGVSLEQFFAVAEDLEQRRIVGRFSTFLEHVKKPAGGEAVTRYNALFHWAVPAGRELDAGREVGRHLVMTHAYWREGGPEFRNVNIMGVAHGLEKDLLLAHKAAIDRHLAEAGIAVGYTNVFWGGRSEIKPSEVSPLAYEQWCRSVGLDPQQMRSGA